MTNRNNIKDIRIPPKDEKLAEFVGIVLGDGHVSDIRGKRSNGKTIRTAQVSIAGHSENDKDYLLNYVKPLCENLFSVKASFYTPNKTRKCSYVRITGVKIVEFMNSIGIPSGNKLKQEVTIPSWIYENKEFLKACIRGLVDTDGSVYRMSYKDPNLWRINLTNHNKKLLKDTRNGLIRVGFTLSKIITDNYFVISRKDEIKRYINIIGFNNPKHRNKLSTAP